MANSFRSDHIIRQQAVQQKINRARSLKYVKNIEFKVSLNFIIYGMFCNKKRGMDFVLLFVLLHDDHVGLGLLHDARNRSRP